MATETAPASPTTVFRNYWQLPVFAIGVAAASAAWAYVPSPLVEPSVAFRSALAHLTAAIEKRPVDLAEVEKYIDQVAEAAAQFPNDVHQINFLIGSGYVVLAEYGSLESAVDYWQMATRYFTHCDPTHLPDPSDAKKYAYRSAKAAAALGTGDPALVLSALNQPPPNEDTAEASRFIADTCMRLNPPDLKRARDELSRYLSLPNRSSLASAARYKLLLATVHLLLNEPEPARRWLADIGTGAPPDVLAMAKIHLGRLATKDNNWAEAAKLFEAAQSIPGLPTDQKESIRYQTGFALLQSGNVAQAGPYLEQAAKQSGPIGAAAALRLAELHARNPHAKGRRTDAAMWLEKAAAVIQSAEDLKVIDMAPGEVRAAFEEVIKRSLSEQDFISAIRAATAYSAVADAGKDRERRAEVNAAWAALLEKSNLVDAKAKHKAAAADYAVIAASFPTAAGRMDALKRAVSHFKKAGATTEALQAVDAFLALNDLTPEDAAQAWLDKAELLPAEDSVAVTEALQKAMSYPGPAASTARLRLAMHHLTRGKQLFDASAGSKEPDRLKQSGQQMVQLGRQMLIQLADASAISPAEKATHEEAIFQLGSQLMSEAQFAEAESRFRKQIQLYPDGKLAGYGRLWLACCLVQQGHTGGPTDPRLQEAVELLSPLLTSSSEFLRTQAEIRTLNTLIVQERYDAVVKLGEELASRYRGRPDELVIGKLLFYSHLSRTPAEPGEALRVLLRMEEAFKEIPPAVFPSDPEYSHARWEKELLTLRQELEIRKN
jgi:hypothetical protein